jgi:hypothetical protein
MLFAAVGQEIHGLYTVDADGSQDSAEGTYGFRVLR